MLLRSLCEITESAVRKWAHLCRTLWREVCTEAWVDMVLLDCGEKPLLGDLYLLELAHGLQEALVARGHGPVINATREALLGWVNAQGVDGVVLAVGADRHSLAEELARRKTPCVVIDQVPPKVIPGVAYVNLDLESGAREAARLLVEYGHLRIGFIGNAEEDFVRAAFLDELNAASVQIAQEHVIIAGMGRAAGASAARAMLINNSRPTAIFARTDVLALGAMSAATDLGIRVPRDLSIIGHDDITLAGTMGLSTVRIDCRALGKVAAEALAELQENSLSQEIPVVRTELILRNTVSRLK